jgi:hypothetical protein
MKHGILSRHDRRPLLMCICIEIIDNWPDPNHIYVGIQAAIEEVAKH